MNVHTNNRQDAELLALREKYSTVCDECHGGGYVGGDGIENIINECSHCHGTGRVMMLDANGVKAEQELVERNVANMMWEGWQRGAHMAYTRVLKGG